MNNKKNILKKRFSKLTSHYIALTQYKQLIDDLLQKEDILKIEKFNFIEPSQRAIFDAYLKRFASIQDFLGAKIFPILLQLNGIFTTKMSEVIYHIEKEEIIDSLEQWVELREIRNELEHDYPEELAEALNDLKYCIDHYETLKLYYDNSISFAKRFNI